MCVVVVGGGTKDKKKKKIDAKRGLEDFAWQVEKRRDRKEKEEKKNVGKAGRLRKTWTEEKDREIIKRDSMVSSKDHRRMSKGKNVERRKEKRREHC